MPSEIITLERSGGTTLTVNLQGGVITSWRIRNIEQLFVPVTADYSPLVRLKGGITLSFPYYPPCENREIYELIRLYHWEVFSPPTATARGNVSATFVMKDNLWTRSVWNASFLFFYRVTLKEMAITCEVRIVNTSPDKPIKFKFHLQMNFQVKDVNEWRVVGLHRETYDDKLNQTTPYMKTLKVDNKEFISYGQKMFRLYETQSDDSSLLFLHRRDECEVRRDGLSPFLTMAKLDRCNFPIVTVRYPWNIFEPNTDVIHEKHFINDAERDAICVGVGHVETDKELKPDDVYKAFLKISAVSPELAFIRMTDFESTDLQSSAWDLTDLCATRSANTVGLQHLQTPMSGNLGFGSWAFSS